MSATYDLEKIEMLNYFGWVYSSPLCKGSLLTSERIKDWAHDEKRIKEVLHGIKLKEKHFEKEFKWLDMFIKNISKAPKPSKNLIRGLAKILSKTENIYQSLSKHKTQNCLSIVPNCCLCSF